MIVGRQPKTQGGLFHIMAVVQGVNVRIGRYHHRLSQACVEADKLMWQHMYENVQVRNASTGWFMNCARIPNRKHGAKRG